MIESDAALVLGSDGQSTLFVSENDPEYMLWNGSRCGVVLAKDHFGVDAVS